ncbi:hypothetical protein Slin14017_G093200 [Septoria linicola]|nr:hypothetical protein Slin14017_G093200 [Septoria linicola]
MPEHLGLCRSKRRKRPKAHNDVSYVLHKELISFARVLGQKEAPWSGADRTARLVTVLHEALHLVDRSPLGDGLDHITDHWIARDIELSDEDPCYLNRTHIQCKHYGRDLAQKLALVTVPKIRLQPAYTNADNYVYYAVDFMIGAEVGLDALPTFDDSTTRSVLSVLSGSDTVETAAWDHNLRHEIWRRLRNEQTERGR